MFTPCEIIKKNIMLFNVMVRSNGGNIVGEQLPTQHFWVLHVTSVLHVVACCWELLRKFVAGANNIGSSCVRWHVLLILTG